MERPVASDDVAPEFQTQPGTFDVLPPDSQRYSALVATFADMAGRAGFGLVVSPMIEDIKVFSRGAGAESDIVSKEMYDFEDKGGRHIALRPEGTASVARAFVQHRPPTPFKAWYAAPNFRYDRPQKGRHRQHHQIGVEAIGTADPAIDVEVITLAVELYQAVGLQQFTVLLNTMGDPTCRPAYRAALLTFLDERAGELCDEHATHYRANPLRVFDCKREACSRATEHAPRQADHLCEACAAHFSAVKAGLDAVGVAYVLDTRLVRGFDYYSRTTFEFAPTTIGGAQSALGGGGRYDGLVELLGGPPTPGIGFGLGIERILLACDAEGTFPVTRPALDTFVIDTMGGGEALTLVAELRRAGVRTDRAYDNRSWNAQLKAALRSGARLAVVIEERGMSVRTLQEKGEPEMVDRATVVEHVRKRLHA